MVSTPRCELCDHLLAPSPRGPGLFACPGCGFARLLPVPAPGAERHDRYFSKVAAKRRRAARLMGWLAREAGGGGEYLDIGCHAGYMLEAAAARGFGVCGIEPAAAARAAAARRVPAARLLAGRLDEVTLPDRAFDLATAIEVIEHDPEPRTFAARLARALKPGALLYVTTPDWSHWRVPRDLARWDGFDPPRHVCYFTPRSLVLLFETSGFDLVRRRRAFKPGVKCLFRRRAGD